jgi:hypothetical protein
LDFGEGELHEHALELSEGLGVVNHLGGGFYDGSERALRGE